MPRFKTIFFLLWISPFFLFAQTAPESLDKTIANLLNALKQSSQQQRVQRLAVADFATTAPSVQDEFSSYFAERLTSAISRENDRFRLFERQRLDVILEEHSLNLSGLIEADQAQRLGELVPLDVILSGTYTKFNNHIDLNSRLIDVVSGEILLTFFGRIKLDKHLQQLFSGSPRTPENQPPATPPCIRDGETIQAMLNNLSTPERVAAIARDAIQIPFDETCGDVHYRVIGAFKRYGKNHPAYQNFLLNTLAGIEYPSNDERARTILSFFAADGMIDNDEWDTGINMLRRSRRHHISSYLSYLLLGRSPEKDFPLTFERIDQYFSLVEKGSIGLPVAISFNDGFHESLEAFGNIYAKENRSLRYVFDNYRQRLTLEGKFAKRLYGTLKTMYAREASLAEKKEILDLICELFQNRPQDKDFASDLYAFANNFKVTSYKKRNPEKLKEFPPEHLPLLLEQCRSLFCDALKLTEYRSQIEDRTDFCLEQSIPCPDVIPDVDACISMLSSPDGSEQLRAMELLERMGSKAAPAEMAILKTLAGEDLANPATTNRIHQSGVTVLGNIRTNKPESLKLLMASLRSTHNFVPDKALDALVTIAAPAVPYLIEGLQSRWGAVQYKSAVGLGRIGNAAGSALPALEEIIRNSNNSAVHSAAEKAIRAIKNAQ